MALNSELKASYEAVMRDLESEKQQVHQQLAPLQARLKELHNSILTLSKKISPDTPLLRTPTPIRPSSVKYANISVRWAILDLLNDTGPMNTAEVAEALVDRGVQSRAANFANNVSAVLSTTMREKHGEVEQLDGKWQLNENGKNAIAHIKTTPKFRRACA